MLILGRFRHCVTAGKFETSVNLYSGGRSLRDRTVARVQIRRERLAGIDEGNRVPSLGTGGAVAQDEGADTPAPTNQESVS